MELTYKALAHRAGCTRKKYKLAPLEAAWCTLWLAGVREEDMPKLAERMTQLKNQKAAEKYGPKL
jgi:hypothetical protein